ncbi:hypothetical protein CBL_14486 [Carabus blaptoides fortunei]
MCVGYAFATFMDALMSFEEERLDEALVIMRDTEKKCAADIGWLKSVKSKMFGSKAINIAEKLENQIILADIQVCVAIITFLQQEFSGYLKGGWVLRKAWKIYHQTYMEIVDIYKKKFGNFNVPEPTDFDWQDTAASSLSRSSSATTDGPSCEWSIPESNAPSPSHRQNGQVDEIAPEDIARLMGAVCFGYGALQLGMSLLPPSLLKVTNFFGFHGNRTAGISNLMYARKGSDMRAPLAMLALLWYHTIVRPFYALDGTNIKAGLEAANLLMQESQSEYEQSALFLFFHGRIYRLDSNIPKALEAFQGAADNSPQREMKLLALHEVGWCHLVKLDFEEAQKVFLHLRQGSRWSRSFYAFLTIVCGASCNRKDILTITELKRLYQTSNTRATQLDIFLQRRLRVFPDTTEALQKTTVLYWKFFIYELIFLWNALPSCSLEDIHNIIEDCNQTDSEPMPGLAMLIQGECYNILQMYENAITSFRKCIATRSTSMPNDDLHISAFAEYGLGVLLLKSPESMDEGKSLLNNAANQYKDSDFNNKLNVRIDMALQRVS